MQTVTLSAAQRLHAWAELVRLPLAFVLAADTLAGAIIAGARWTQVAEVAPLVLASAVLWAAANALGDWYTCKDDAAFRPQRPIPSKRINRWQALFASLVLLALGAVLAGAPSPLTTSRVAMMLVVAIALSRVILCYAPASAALDILYRPLNMLLGLVVVPLAASPACAEFRVYLLTAVGIGSGTLVLLDKHEWHGYRSRRLALLALPAIVAGVAVAAMPLFFEAAAPSLMGTIWAALLLGMIGYRFVQVILSPSGTTVTHARQAVAIGHILLAASATAYTRHPWASLLVVMMAVPAAWAMWYVATPPVMREPPGTDNESGVQEGVQRSPSGRG